MSGSSAIVITYNGTNITSHVLFETARFESQINATPGEFEFTVKDESRTLSFVTGKEVTLSVDGTLIFGGYLLQVSRTFAFPVVKTTTLSQVKSRYWVLRGVDYNILFDKRVLRKTSNYLSQIPSIAGSTMDGTALKAILNNYVDLDAAFTSDLTEIDNITTVSGDGTSPWSYKQQGTKLRDSFEDLAQRSGAVYYIAPDKRFHWHSLESVEARWGFSDQPNKGTITTSPLAYQGSTYGFRDVEAVEDGSVIVNDALIWGGSEFAGSSGGTVFHRTENTTSQTDHGRWQLGEVHFGEEGYGIVDGVTARANAIVNGPPGATSLGEEKGLRFSQWDITFTWFGHQVPFLSGVRNHLYPGDLVTIALNVFGLTKVLPLRRITITFPSLAPDGSSWVQFEGNFALQQSDPFTIWRFLLRNQNRIIHTTVSTTTGSSTSSVYGSIGHFTPTPTPNSSATVFDLPFGYIPGTLQVYKNGLALTPGTDYTETAHTTGGFTMATAPATGSSLYCITRTLSS
jgi:hypothetical protein